MATISVGITGGWGLRPPSSRIQHLYFIIYVDLEGDSGPLVLLASLNSLTGDDDLIFNARLANRLFLVYDFLALWRSILSARVPESHKLKTVG